MKKISTILFALAYLTLSSGIIFEVHYCEDEVKAISLYSEADSCCCESEASPVDCCTDEQVVVQFTADDQLNNAKAYTLKQPARITEIVIPVVEDIHSVYKPHAGAHGATLQQDIPIWIRHCNLTYYG